MKMHQKQFPVEMMCRVLKVSSSAFYAWKNGFSTTRLKKELELKQTIETIYNGSHYTYGSPRVFEVLKQAGHKVSRSLVARVMKKFGFRSIHAKKFKVTTNSSHKYPVAENILDRDFTATRPAQKWVSDLTYISTKEGWLYLTVMLDLYDRKVIGWAMSDNMTARDTVIVAWRMAKKNRPIIDELLFHSDRGIQYACNEFTQTINHPLITQSMSRKEEKALLLKVGTTQWRKVFSNHSKKNAFTETNIRLEKKQKYPCFNGWKGGTIRIESTVH
jgi:transposase InsO family protein